MKAGDVIHWLYAAKKGKKAGVLRPYTGTILKFTRNFMVVKYHRKLIKFRLKKGEQNEKSI